MRIMELQRLVRKNINTLEPYSSARDDFKDQGRNMVYLDANESPFRKGLNRYPDPQQKLLKKIISGIKKVDEDCILLGNGSDEVLDLLFRAFCEPNVENVITLPPTYGMYGVLSSINAIENREVQLLPNFQPDIKAIVNAIDLHTKLIFLCSPNNPTGNCFSDEAVTDLLTAFKGIVVIDEAYIDFSDKGSWLDKLRGYPNLVVVQTLSKAYGLAGIRLGILYGSRQIIDVLNKIKPPYNINQLTQLTAIKELAYADRTLSQIQIIKDERDKLMQQLKKIPFIEKVFSSDANFILVQVDNAAKRYSQLIESGIVVRNRSSQPLCSNCLRITVGTPSENNKLIKIVRSL